jgi:DNA polymerase elongation subunit (family B)
MEQPNQGTVIHFGDTSKYPKRSDFTSLHYRHVDVSGEVQKAINDLKTPNNETKMLFIPNDIRAMDWCPLGEDYKTRATADTKAKAKAKADGTKYVQRPLIPPKYCIFMFGVAIDGSKTLVVLKNIPVWLDIRYPDDVIGALDKDIAESAFIKTLRVKYLEPYGRKLYTNMDKIYGYPLKGFYTSPIPYMRITFPDMHSRSEVLKLLQPYGCEHDKGCASPYELASNDSATDYHNKISRDFKYFTCGWNYFTKGVLVSPDKYGSPQCAYTIEVDIEDFHAYDLEPMDQITSRVGDSPDEIERRRIRAAEIAEINTARARVKDSIGFLLEKDRTMVCAWDIETYSKKLLSAKFTSPQQFQIFMIGMTFHWQYTAEPLVKVCLVDKDTDPDPNYITIKCDNERGVITAFIEILTRMSPDILCAFNGGGFDWNCINIKLNHYKVDNRPLMEVFKNKVSCMRMPMWNRFKTDRPMKVKISAELPTHEMTICDLPGIIDTDVMPVFKQLYTRQEIGRFQGLNFFAQKNKLGGKEDMPYKVMFAIYEGKRVIEYDAKRDRVLQVRDATPDENRADMNEVARYCVKDALLCQQLYAIRSIVADKRELSNMSRVTLWDSFYRAGGSKVLNTLGFYCNWYDEQEDIRFNIMFDNHHHKKKDISYPGGFVPSPERGVEKELPITGLDFASLYPSLQMTYNFSPDKVTSDAVLKAQLEKQGYVLHPIHVPVFIKRADPLDESPVEILEERNGWAIRHCENKPPAQRLPGESIGIIPYILRKLFAERKKVKNEKVALEKIEEDMIVEGRDNTDEFQDVLFRLNATDTKQRAMKVIMNTFYGKAGDSSSSIFELLVSGGITEMGQRNIKFVAQLARDMGCIVKYGDTDSVYVTCPRDTYEDCTRRFNDDVASAVASANDGGGNYKATPEYRARVLAFNEEKVSLTIARIVKIKDAINAALAKDNGTKYLTVAYEEVLFPTLLLGKKKYAGIAHMGKPNFAEIKSIGDLFVRGIDIIKQGQTDLAKKVGFELLRDILDIYSTRDIMELVMEKIHEIANTKWETQHFVKKHKYRPDKKNVSVLRFVERMREERRLCGDD